MAILNIDTNVAGLVGVVPRQIYIQTTDDYATITATGYLNKAVQNGLSVSNSDIALVYGTDLVNGLPGSVAFSVQIDAPNTNLVEAVDQGGVQLPVTVNHIATFTNTDGQIGDVTAPAIHAGNIQAGLSGTAGHFVSYPSLPSAGTLQLVAASNSGNTATILTNAEMGQASTLTFQDPGAAAANVAMAPAALVNGNLIQASGTVGLIADSGVATSAVQLKANIKAAVTGNIGGAGAGPITVTVAGMTASSVVTCTIASSSNAVEVEKAVAGSGSFNVTFSGDPGATCTLNYVAFIAAQ